VRPVKCREHTREGRELLAARPVKIKVERLQCAETELQEHEAGRGKELPDKWKRGGVGCSECQKAQRASRPEDLMKD